MAKITITIEDRLDGRVKVASDPTFEQLVKMAASGFKLTAAHGYAFKAINAIHQASRQMSKLVIGVPRLKPRGFKFP